MLFSFTPTFYDWRRTDFITVIFHTLLFSSPTHLLMNPFISSMYLPSYYKHLCEELGIFLVCSCFKTQRSETAEIGGTYFQIIAILKEHFSSLVYMEKCGNLSQNFSYGYDLLELMGYSRKQKYSRKVYQVCY